LFFNNELKIFIFRLLKPALQGRQDCADFQHPRCRKSAFLGFRNDIVDVKRSVKNNETVPVRKIYGKGMPEYKQVHSPYSRMQNSGVPHSGFSLPNPFKP